MTEQEIREEYSVLEKSKTDLNAFGFLYEKYFDRIFNFIYRQTEDEELTADICSQTFLNALKDVSNFQFRGVPVSAWFYRIASNEVNKYYRKRKQSRIFSLEEVRIKELIHEENEGWDEELINRLVEYLKELPAEMLNVLQLRFFENLDFKTIAFVLGITESGAKMRTYRALDQLRKNFNIRVRYHEKK